MFLVVGICLIGYTVKTIVFKPDYTIKTEYDDDLNFEDPYLLFEEPNLLFKESNFLTEAPNLLSEEPKVLSVDQNEGLSEITPNTVKNQEVSISHEKGDYVGTLIIPSLDYELPIYEGTGTSELNKGVGRYIGSAQPGEADNCVLSGHRETVFSKLGDLKIGEIVIVKSNLGRFYYEVNATRIVDEDDRTVIVHYDEAILTLTTCYPFVYIGAAPQRYIVSAKLIKSDSLD